jgi:homoserine kinase type II
MAVYTKVSDDELSAFLKEYSVGSLVTKTPIAEGIENTNYRIDTTKGRFILTLFEKRVSVEDLPFFMSLTGHLSSKGLPVAAPVANVDGDTIAQLAGRPAALIHFLDGRPHMSPNPADCIALGAMLASLHQSVRDFPASRTNPLSLKGWGALADACRETANQCAPGLAAEIDAEWNFLQAHWPTGLPSGVIHSDLFPDNVLFNAEHISGVIDFYFSCSDFFAYDLAVCVNAWCFDGGHKFSTANAQGLIKSYFDANALNTEERDAFGILLRGAALRFLLTRLYDWLNQIDGALVTIKDPLECRNILTFHREHYSPSLYGF